MAFVLLAAPLLVWRLAVAAQSQQSANSGFDYAVFKDPPAEYREHAMWGYNTCTVTDAQIISSVQDLAKQFYGGFFIIGGPTVQCGTKNLAEAYVRAMGGKLNAEGIEYLSDEYFRLYKLAVEEAKKNGLSAILYADHGGISGSAGGVLYTKYPQYAAKSLDMVEKDVTGPAKADLAIPEGTYVGAVMMNRDTFERVDVSDRRAQGNHLVCQVPKGNWKVMAFYLNLQTHLKYRKSAGVVDYLDEAAMDAYLSVIYEKFYAHLREYFGNVIKIAYHDEPAMHQVDGRMWTPAFNQNFEKKYGYSPMKYYPALWYDIGPETAAARNALHGFRAQLWAENYIGKLNKWCDDHGIQLTGHLDMEENPNPVPVNGDLMKSFEHQDIPGVDDIYFLGRSNTSYKVVTSSAFNYDKPVVMAETYASYYKLDKKIAFQAAMDQYAMGVSFQIPEYFTMVTKSIQEGKRDASQDFAPASRVGTVVPGSRGEVIEITRMRDYAAELNRYVGRLSYLLQHGRHVADVAVLYPIAALQGCYKFIDDRSQTGDSSARSLLQQMPMYGREGGVLPPEIDYMDVGEMLYRALRVDYTYLHPEVLVSRCTVDRQRLVLNNKENREEYSVLIVPGGDTLSVATAAKIKEFYDKGGVVIATSKLPTKSAEFGRDKEIQKMVADVFGLPVDEPVTAEFMAYTDQDLLYFVNRNKLGGRAFFLPKAEANLLNEVFKQVLPVRDVDIQAEMGPVQRRMAYNGALTYIHKVKNGRDIYFFANSSEKPVDTKVVLRGKKDLAIWNPHTGEREEAKFTNADMDGQPVTTVQLTLQPVTSVFYIQD
jgi:hypothetical protein